MKRVFLIFVSIMLIMSMAGCGDAEQDTQEGVSEKEMTDANEKALSGVGYFSEKENITNMKMNVQIGNISFTVALKDNAATGELIEMMR